ncbi:MAG TPA: hypothetical protein VMV73_05405 [Candidatus Dormibacteraeota bacterium]|nr:hypothetical protein [Candidatus Dormibacteraeota bacterium]
MKAKRAHKSGAPTPKRAYIVRFCIDDEELGLRAFTSYDDACVATDLWENYDAFRKEMLGKNPAIDRDSLPMEAGILAREVAYSGTMVYQVDINCREQVKIDSLLERMRLQVRKKKRILATRSDKKEALLSLLRATKWPIWSNMLASALQIGVDETFELIEECKNETELTYDRIVEVNNGWTIVLVRTGPESELRETPPGV